MTKKLSIILIMFLLVPVIFGAIEYRDTFIFDDETPEKADKPGSLTFIPAKYKSDTLGLVILRMGSRVKGFFVDGSEKWSWLPLVISAPNNPASLDTIDFQGDGELNDVAYISGQKKVTIREGQQEGEADTLWEKSFDDDVHSLTSTDYNNDGKLDDLLVGAGQKIYAFNPGSNSSFGDFTINDIPYIIVSADLDGDGSRDDVVVGTWTEIQGAEEGSTISNGKIRGFSSNGNPLWTYPSNKQIDSKVTNLKAFDRDSDGKDSDIIAIFTEIKESGVQESDLYIISGGNEIFSRSDVMDAYPADLDGDEILDDFFLITETQLFAYNSKTPPTFIDSLKTSDFNTTTDGRRPSKLLKVSSYSEQPEEGKNIFNDVAIFAYLTEEQRVIFFAEDLFPEETTTTTMSITTTTTTTTTTLQPQPPTARITGISDGTTVSEGSTYTLSAASSSDPDGVIVSYQWLVDDILRGTNRDFSFSAQGLSSGAHIITLKVTDNNGMVGVTTITISIAAGNVPPLANAGEDQDVLEETKVTLSASFSSDPDGEIESYEWSEDDTVFSLEVEVEKTFALGEHTITLKIKDDMGATSTDTIVVTVFKENIPPKADAGEDATVTEGASVHFTAEGSVDVDGNITSYLWILPDGKEIKKAEFDAKFPAGTHNLTLNVTDDKGAVDSDEITITVVKPPNFFERIRTDYGEEIKIAILTLLSAVFAVIIFLRSREQF
jgi:hypothetical protein